MKPHSCWTFGTLWLGVATLTCCVVAPVALAQIAISANDNKMVLVNGVATVVQNPAPDTVAILDLQTFPPKILAEIDVPTSVVGPPMSVAITPDESLALVTAAMKIDPNDTTKQTPDNRLSVIDLKAAPPAVIATLETGKGPAGLSIDRQGTLALVANRAEGTVSVFSISGKEVKNIGAVKIGDEKTGVSHVAISPDGKTALVTRDGDSIVSVLAIDGTKVEYTKRDLTVGMRPYGAAISADGTVAVVANIGRGSGDHDTVSVIDMTAKPVRTVDTITVGQTPEGINLSQDGKLCAVVVMNGSNKPKDSPFFNDAGKVVVYRVEQKKLVKLAEAPIGHWSQGVAFTPDNQYLMVQNMVEKDLMLFKLAGDKLEDTGQRLQMKGGPAAIRTADKVR
ncbi:MAG: YncE family protein [Candidatus Tectomicrobia bacterium]|uniref:YncE family protein n=1 Tax=Tectimicrobiota bacterium TaxID=2528274 RepID=A0A937W375_UNCTE|nr:YncE family protein [Candidatus Tectomicrobia bacterium]